MRTLANSEYAGEMPHNAVFHQSSLFAKTNKISSRKKYNILYTMKHPDFIVSNQKE